MSGEQSCCKWKLLNSNKAPLKQPHFLELKMPEFFENSCLHFDSTNLKIDE